MRQFSPPHAPASLNLQIVARWLIHELASPMGAVQGAVELAQQDPASLAMALDAAHALRARIELLRLLFAVDGGQKASPAPAILMLAKSQQIAATCHLPERMATQEASLTAGLALLALSPAPKTMRLEYEVEEKTRLLRAVSSGLAAITARRFADSQESPLFALVRHAAHEAGGRVAIAQEKTELQFEISLPQAPANE